MTKSSRAVMIALIAACLILGALFCVTSGKAAYADGFSPESLAFIEQPSDIDATYGDEIEPLQAKLNYDVEAEYAWYVRETPTRAAVKYATGISSGSELSLLLRKATESGYYYCIVSAVTYKGARYPVSLTSEQAHVAIAKKEAEVTLGKAQFVYNGSWQTPTATVKAEDVLQGDVVEAYVETEIASTDVGTYQATVRMSNDNYAVKGNNETTVTITPAPLKIYVKEVAVRAGLKYDLEIVYEGLQGDDEASVLSFTPTVPKRYYNVTEAGIYDVVCSGLGADGNYTITYPTSKLYVNEKELTAEKIDGAEATAGGSFKADTRLQLTQTDGKLPGFSIFKFVRTYYDVDFVSGGADGDTYTLNLSDDGAMKFLLAACYVDEEGKTHAAQGLKAADGTISVTVPTTGVKSIVIYNDWTIVILVGALLALILLIMIIAIAKSKRRYRRAQFYYRTAQQIARERQDQQTYDE